MKPMMDSWLFWAMLSAIFAALTAVLAKVGVKGISSDMATLIRTVVVLAVLAAIVAATGQWQAPQTLPGRTLLFLALSGLATGASWLCYFRALQLGEVSKVAPIDKLSVVLVAIFGAVFLGETLTGPSLLGVALIASGAVVLALAG
jgi:transporter family protein